MDTDNGFGLWLQQRRRALDMTQADLARQVGCARNTITKIETNRRRPSKQMAVRLAQALQLDDEIQEQFIQLARRPVPAADIADDQPLHLEGVPPAGSSLHLPIPLTPLLGREDDIATIVTLLLRPDVRLLTLFGPPGIGKTRLGLHVAAELRTHFTHGVCFVPLATVHTPDLVAPAIAQTLGVAETMHHSLLSTLRQVVQEQHLLLVLDNFEHLLDAATLLVNLLASAPRLKLLITSRAVLNLSGEHQFCVSPLRVPDYHLQHTPTALLQNPSVALFVAHTQALLPEWTLTEEHAGAVASLCAHLEGIPLAIELAAARIKIFSPQEMLAQLQRPAEPASLHFLEATPADWRLQQPTLRAALDWSYRLLAPQWQIVLRRLSVFVGGWTMEAAAVVCNADGSLGVDIAAGISVLLDHSLVQRHAPAGSGAVRFTQLETIREYAQEHLIASGELALMQRHHAMYYLKLARAVASAAEGTRYPSLLTFLEHEHANLRAALRWAINAQEFEIALQLSIVLERFWIGRGLLSEGGDWLELALQRTDPAPSPLRVKAYHVAGHLAFRRGQFAHAQALFEHGYTMAQSLEDSLLVAQCLNDLGIVHMLQGHFACSQAFFEQSLELFQALGNVDRVVAILINMGLGAFQQGDLARARALGESSAQAARGLQNRSRLATALSNYGSALLAVGELHEARMVLNESIAIYQAVGEPYRSNYARIHQGRLLLEEGDYTEACIVIHHALRQFYHAGDQRGTLYALEAMADVALKTQRPVDAAKLLGGTEAVREALSVPIHLGNCAWYDRLRAQLAMQLAEPIRTTAWNQGRAMTLEELVALAVEY